MKFSLLVIVAVIASYAHVVAVDVVSIYSYANGVTEADFDRKYLKIIERVVDDHFPGASDIGPGKPINGRRLTSYEEDLPEPILAVAPPIEEVDDERVALRGSFTHTSRHLGGLACPKNCNKKKNYKLCRL
jgi:hypothetical protein